MTSSKSQKILTEHFIAMSLFLFFLNFTHFENKMKNLNNLCNNSSRTSHLYLGSCLEETELYHHTEFQNLYLPLILCSPKEIYRTNCFAWLCTNVVFFYFIVCVYVKHFVSFLFTFFTTYLHIMFLYLNS